MRMCECVTYAFTIMVNCKYSDCIVTCKKFIYNRNFNFNSLIGVDRSVYLNK